MTHPQDLQAQMSLYIQPPASRNHSPPCDMRREGLVWYSAAASLVTVFMCTLQLRPGLPSRQDDLPAKLYSLFLQGYCLYETAYLLNCTQYSYTLALGLLTNYSKLLGMICYITWGLMCCLFLHGEFHQTFFLHGMLHDISFFYMVSSMIAPSFTW